MKIIRIAGVLTCVLGLTAVQPAMAACVTKYAEATSGSAKSAKWFVLETMVQSVSWSLWPGFVATNKVAGYKIKDEKYKCKSSGGGVICRGRATFCPTG